MPRGRLTFPPWTRCAENREGEKGRSYNLVKDKVKSKRRKTRGRARVIITRRSNGYDYKKSCFLNVVLKRENTLFIMNQSEKRKIYVTEILTRTVKLTNVNPIQILM